MANISRVCLPVLTYNRKGVEGDEEAADDWIDSLMSFGVEALNARPWNARQAQVPSSRLEMWVLRPGIERYQVSEETIAVYVGQRPHEEKEGKNEDQPLSKEELKEGLPRKSKKIQCQEDRIRTVAEFLKKPHNFTSLTRTLSYKEPFVGFFCS